MKRYHPLTQGSDSGMNSEAPANFSGRLSGTRRRLISALLWLFTAITAAGMAFPLGMYLWPRKRRRKSVGKRSMKLPLGDVPIRDVKFFRILNKPIVIIRPNEQEVTALSAICTHLGCIVRWKEGSKELDCPCHGGRFDLKGFVIGGPPPRPLPRYPVTVENGYIVIEEA